MKRLIFAIVITLFFAAEGAFGACSQPDATQVTNTGANTDLSDLLSGNTVCVINPAPQDTKHDPPWDKWLWQEEHLGDGGGDLYDYKLGPGHPVDPRRQLGTWAVTGNGANSVVTYNYTAFVPNDTRTMEVWHNDDGTYSFCDVSSSDPPEPDEFHEDIVATSIQSGTGSPCTE